MSATRARLTARRACRTDDSASYDRFDEPPGSGKIGAASLTSCWNQAHRELKIGRSPDAGAGREELARRHAFLEEDRAAERVGLPSPAVLHEAPHGRAALAAWRLRRAVDRTCVMALTPRVRRAGR